MFFILFLKLLQILLLKFNLESLLNIKERTFNLFVYLNHKIISESTK